MLYRNAPQQTTKKACRMPADYNPYVNGVKVMTSAEMQRHALNVCNMLNRGENILSRDVAFLLGYTRQDLSTNIYAKRLKVGLKVLGCRHIYDKQDVLTMLASFNSERAKWRINPYNGKSMQFKDNAKLMQMVYNNLKG